MERLAIPLPLARVKRSASAQILLREWPELHKACVNTYFEFRQFNVVDENSRSPAGYMLHAATAAAKLYQEKHSHRPLDRHALDESFAGELWYHYSRGRSFNRPCAALYQALLALVVERPEKMQRRQK